MSGTYSYVHLRGKWVIYHNSLPTGDWYNSMEDARKRVFELNGWEYKGPLPRKKKPFEMIGSSI